MTRASARRVRFPEAPHRDTRCDRGHAADPQVINRFQVDGLVFLEEQGFPEAQVATLIRSTHPDHVSQRLSEQVLHDAELIHVGKKTKFTRSPNASAKNGSTNEAARIPV